ncbi:acriflavin resistance protein [Romboutsia weinsteinii]|uniref:Acriflavin resistance protein n=1 Tax=Romboutsia weinsteinii TaxID=2020949 RepID=A0A371J1D1_9FIRM|nr:efflux RND transporter permease subunit [Romboutsia weinsteinii]RDY26515.1 acriflavin resistance protein [Romboutsia weinsteinii]
MISKFSVKKPLTVVVAVVMVFILGIVSFTNMTTDLLPSIDLPYVMVMTNYPGASPEKVETTVTKPIEQALATTSGVENITSVSRANSSMVMLEFNQKINMDSAMIDMSGQIDLIKGQFEEGVGSPMLMKMNPDMMPVMTVSVDVNNMDIKEISTYVNNEIIPEFERIDGVASVTATGLIEEKLKITLDKNKIEDINEKVFTNVDSELHKKQQDLNKAKSELQSSKSSLETESKTQTQNLANASVELQSGKQKLESAVAAIGMSREEIIANLDNSNAALKEIQTQIKTIEELINKASQDPNYDAKDLEIKLNVLKESENKLTEGIKIAEQGVTAIDSLAQLKEKEKELESGKLTLNQELSKASAQISNGENELKKAQTQLDEARESAHKSADISGKITPDMMSKILTAENFSMPAGYLNEGEQQYLVKVGDEFSSIDELENLLLFNIDVEGIGNIYLKDVASVKIADNSDETYANINGNDGVILSFQKSSVVSTSNVTKSINKTIESLSKTDKDTHITTLMDQGVYIDMIVSSVLDNLIYGGVLAIIILLIFLKSIKPTIIIAFSIPISLLFSIVLMYFSGITLNIISLSGLALGVGMLVDNSIVVIENIYRLRNQGMSITKSAVYGAKQVSGAIFASTLTTICVFLPIVFTEGMTRQLFTDMGLTIAYSLVASLIVALTLVPAMASKILTNVDTKSHSFFDKVISVYEKLLRWTLKYKALVLLFSVALLVFCGYKTMTMGTSFMPTMDSTQMTATMNMPEDSKREDKLNLSDEFIEKVRKIDDVETVGAIENSDSGAMLGSSSSDMSFYIILKEDKSLSNKQVEKLIYEKTKDMNCEIKISASAMDMGSLGGSGIEIVIKGKELDKLQEISKDISKLLKGIDGIQDISDGMDDSSSETRVIVNKNKAMEYGLTVAQVYQEIMSAIKSETSSTNLNLGSEEYPIIIVNDNNVSKDSLSKYKIKGTKNNEEIEIKLDEIAKIDEAQSPSSINHDNQVRYMSVTASIDSDHNIGLVSRDVEDELKDYEVPNGYNIELQGENENINKSLRDLVLMIMLAIVFIYLIMVAQFQSLLSPFIVMFTIPLAFTGGLLALIITNNDLSIISMLGFLVLSGVVVNNGIVFVDYVNQLRLEGMNKKDAIIIAGKTRIRPILMTALTTILAMSTMAVGVGMGAEMTQGLAIVTIGGLAYATLLTLLVVPALYDLLHRRPLKPIVIEED